MSLPIEMQVRLRSRYTGPPEVARAFEVATADLYEASGHSDILAFEVSSVDGVVLGRFEGYVTVSAGVTPEQFTRAIRESAS